MVAFAATADLMPIYAVYPLLFSDRGLSVADISLLFLAWSLVGFAFEVPSGAWADAVDRRLLLVSSGGVLVAAYSSWMFWQAFPGFLLGFVLWGLAGAMESGTFEALLYDELAAEGRAGEYARIRGLSQAAAMLASVVAIASAGWLMPLGGYPLVGWLSVGMALVHTGFAWSLPRARAVEDAAGAGYFAMLRDGVAEVARVAIVRKVVLVSAAMIGLTAVDEYFPLIGSEHGLSSSRVPWMFALLVAGQSAGTACAGLTARWPASFTATSYAIGAVLFAVGLLVGGWWCYAVAAVGYGLISNAYLVAETRLQEVIETRARATVTSVSALATEVFALAAFAGVGLGVGRWSLAIVVAAFAVPMLATAALARRWLPPAG